MAKSRNPATFYVKWDTTKALELQLHGDVLRIKAENANIELEPRSATIEAPYSYKKEVPDVNRKTLYIGFREPLKPLEAPRIDILGRSYIGNFEVIYTNLDFEKYLTIITPSHYLYDYVVLTGHEIMFHMIARRQVYYEEEPYDKVTVYFV